MRAHVGAGEQCARSARCELSHPRGWSVPVPSICATLCTLCTSTHTHTRQCTHMRNTCTRTPTQVARAWDSIPLQEIPSIIAAIANPPPPPPYSPLYATNPDLDRTGSSSVMASRPDSPPNSAQHNRCAQEGEPAGLGW